MPSCCSVIRSPSVNPRIIGVMDVSKDMRCVTNPELVLRGTSSLSISGDTKKPTRPPGEECHFAVEIPSILSQQHGPELSAGWQVASLRRGDSRAGFAVLAPDHLRGQQPLHIWCEWRCPSANLSVMMRSTYHMYASMNRCSCSVPSQCAATSFLTPKQSPRYVRAI